MRDRKRILKILTELYIFWNKNPDLRLGQLVSNFSDVKDSFFFEDDKLLEKLKDANKDEIHKELKTLIPYEKLLDKISDFKEANVIDRTEKQYLIGLSNVLLDDYIDEEL